MNAPVTTAIILVCLFGAIFAGMSTGRRLPSHHLNSDTKDTVKLAMGLVATMSALLLGLLVGSAKGSYDAVRGEVLQMAAKVALLDRVLHLYGADAAMLRTQFRTVVADETRELWSGEAGVSASTTQAGDAIFVGIHGLSPQTDAQRALKSQAGSLAVDLGQLRSLLRAQSLASISRPLLVVVVVWLLIIFFGFSVLAPRNATATLALSASACSVAGAIFLILEMDQPLTGLIHVSNDPLLNALR